MENLPFVINVSIGTPQLEITISKAGTVSLPDVALPPPEPSNL